MNGSHPKIQEIKEKMENTDRKPSQKVYLIAQELELIKMLAGNEQKTKNKALKSLNKWLLKRSKTMPFTEEDLQRIWKGLYYCMWMSDKPLVQEECAEKISKLIHFPDLATSLLFFKSALFILSHEWSGIQQLRLDKFLMLVRRLLREMLNVLKEKEFNKDSIQSFNEVLLGTVLNKTNDTPIGLFMHFIEIFMEELAKVSNGKIQPSQVLEFLKPFIQCLATSTDGRQIGYLRKYIFTYLIRQSKLGLQYQEKYEAWRQQGFPGSIDSMQKIKVDINDDSDDEAVSEETPKKKERPLDPRAGRVDVEIPRLPFKPHDVANALLEYKFDTNSSAQSRAMIRTLADQFTSLAKGVYPLGIKKIEVKDKNEDMNVRKAANRLIKLDQKLLGKNKKRKRDKENNEHVDVPEKRKKVEHNQNEVVDIKLNKKKIKEAKGEIIVNGDNSDKLKKIKNKDKNKKIKKDKQKQNKNNLTLLNDNIEKETKIKHKKLNSEKFNIDDKKSKIKSKNSSITAVDNTKIKSNIIKAKNKVKNKEETKEHRIKKNKKGQDPNETVECIFERNSGTWVVYEVENSMQTEKSKLPKSTENFTPAKSSSKQGKRGFQVSKILTTQSSLTEPLGKKFYESQMSSSIDTQNLGLAPVKLFESPPKEKELFPNISWDEPLQEGEYEICIPSRKYISKMKKLAKNKDKSVHELINTTLEKIRGKSRMSLDSRLVNNPFSKPSSTKKVKINTKLNKSQEVYEHYSSVKSSPGIPFDANKKPSKPLLKPTAASTPINPFYKKQLHI